MTDGQARKSGLLKQYLRGEQHRSRGGPVSVTWPNALLLGVVLGCDELRMIQGVDAFKAQLELDAFLELRVLDDRKIQVVDSIGADSRKAGT